MGLKVAAFLLIGALATGSTCRNQSGGEVTKEPEKSPDITLDGVDTSALTPREKKEWSAYVSEMLSPCSDVPVPIAQCVQEKRACPKCMPAAKYVLKAVRDGQTREQLDQSYKNRFDPQKIKNVNLDDSPSKGPESAPVTIVEFADFECPYCAIMAPMIEKSWSERRSQIRFVYKFFPLSGHAHGEIAARAAIAAISQQKFWEMHDMLFGNREHLEQSDLDGYAKDLGLDITRFHADMQSPATTDRIARDKKTAEGLEVKGTPTIFINGREFDPHQELGDWITLELAQLGESRAASAVTASSKPLAVDAGKDGTSPASPERGPHQNALVPVSVPAPQR